ncbi:DUF1957 domain-containing protein [Candidatus Fermentibacteria bacterium]|nr:DUF1957 domain-containing protein [Candidatus Fermentibacteria bacterium]
MTSPRGYLLLVLHAHLPFVRHPEHEEFLEENWLFEALDETYYPLLDMLDRLANDRIPFVVTMSMTPPLCEMLIDPLLRQRYRRRLDRMDGLLALESARTEGSDLEPVVAMYAARYAAIRTIADRWESPVAGFRHFQDQGLLEIVTCPGTHPVLPFCATDAGRRAHVRVAVQNYLKHFGRRPTGVWLPECAYAPGTEDILAEVGLDYFFLDTHGVLYAAPRPRRGVYAPVYCPNGIAAFARDAETSHQVWSAESGYPGDPDYREFYRDVGFDAEYDYVRPFLMRDGVRRNIGLKYHRVTGRVPLHRKSAYDPQAARVKAALHARDFVSKRQAQARRLEEAVGRPPLIVAPYDAELFGHWWFEGPLFIEALMRALAREPGEVRTITAPDYLAQFPKNQEVTPLRSSWGAGGYFDVWLNDRNDWIYRHLHKAEERMIELAHLLPAASGLPLRALNQAARELMLAQSSDWAFIMNAGTMVEYAEKRTRDHLHNFNGIYLQLKEDRLEPAWIRELEARNSIFQEMDYRVFS